MLQWPSQSEHDGTRVAGCAGAAAGVSDRGGREREGPVAAGRPLAQMSPGRWAASSFILPRSLPAATGLGLRCAGGRHVFWKAVGGSGAGPRCPWRRNKGGGGGRRPTPEDIRRKGYRGPAPDTPTAAPGKRQCTFLPAPQMGEEPIKSPADQGEVSGAGERVLGEEPPFRDLLQGMGEIHNRRCACRGL